MNKVLYEKHKVKDLVFVLSASFAMVICAAIYILIHVTNDLYLLENLKQIPSTVILSLFSIAGFGVLFVTTLFKIESLFESEKEILTNGDI